MIIVICAEGIWPVTNGMEFLNRRIVIGLPIIIRLFFLWVSTKASWAAIKLIQIGYCHLRRGYRHNKFGSALHNTILSGIIYAFICSQIISYRVHFSNLFLSRANLRVFFHMCCIKRQSLSSILLNF